MEDVVSELGERTVSINVEDDYFIDQVRINNEAIEVVNRESFDSGVLELDDKVEVSYLRRIESILVYKGSDKGIEIGEGLTSQTKSNYYLVMELDAFGEFISAKLIKYWIDSNKTKLKSKSEIALSSLSVKGKKDWLAFSQLSNVDTPISLLSGKVKLSNLGLDKDNILVEKNIAASLKGSLILNENQIITQLKRTWKLDKGLIKEANSFLPKNLAKSELESMPNLDDVMRYLLDEKLVSYELLID